MKGKVYQLFKASFAVFLSFYNDIKYTVFASLALQYLAVDELRFNSNKFRNHTNLSATANLYAISWFDLWKNTKLRCAIIYLF